MIPAIPLTRLRGIRIKVPLNTTSHYEKYILPTALCLPLFAFAATTVAFNPLPVHRSVAPVTATGIGALGRIEPCSEVRHIHAPSTVEPPVIAELRVSVGQHIAAGEILALLDSHARETADLELARADILLAEKSLAKVRAGVKAGEIAAQQALVEQTSRKLQLAERQLERFQTLSDRQATSRDDLDVRQSEVDVLRRELTEHQYRQPDHRKGRPCGRQAAPPR